MTNTKQATAERLKEIKQCFKGVMDGNIAASMRNKQAGVKMLNWGVTVPRLLEMAAKEGKDYDLAIALWKENVRECKILATMIMPPELMLPEVADIWIEQTPTQEIAEQAAFNLYQHLPYAGEQAFLWIASAETLHQLCGFHVLSRLFRNGSEPNEPAIHEFTDQALAALHSESSAVRKAAMQALQNFASLGLVYKRIASSATRSHGFEFI